MTNIYQKPSILLICTTLLITAGCSQQNATTPEKELSSGAQVKALLECVIKNISEKNQTAVQVKSKELCSAMISHKTTDPETCKKADYVKMEADCLNTVKKLVSSETIEESSKCLNAITPTCAKCHDMYKPKK